eukprot:532766-Prymnesium_polylepis.2
MSPRKATDDAKSAKVEIAQRTRCTRASSRRRRPYTSRKPSAPSTTAAVGTGILSCAASSSNVETMMPLMSRRAGGFAAKRRQHDTKVEGTPERADT